ncbi:hypothetical protein F5Y03DRAFT_410857 [Xylaria venustula]|nr:hypothetical protein F5Y03DRAFT_410857 [Xylaria venustula]
MAEFADPCSPWAARYGIDSDVTYSLVNKDDGHIHSGLAPMRPSLDARFHDVEPAEDDFDPPRTYHELDQILVAEDNQCLALMGIPSYMAAPLNSVLSYWGESPDVLGGHRPGDAQIYPQLFQAYVSQRIEIDRTTWLPFFGQNRWYDYNIEGDPDIIKTSVKPNLTISNWTVDNEEIWSHLSFIIEIANRILLTLIRDNNTWLGTLLYGRIQRWYQLYGDPSKAEEHKLKGEDKKILLTPSYERSECVKMKKPFVGREIEPDAEKRREYLCQLLKNHVWTFMPRTASVRGDTSYIDPKQMTVARLNSGFLGPLCGDTITIAERCVLYARLSMTMLHEIMHAIMMMRVAVFHENVARELHGILSPEPFINGEPIAEVGRSFEAAVFGGDVPFMDSKYARRIPIAELGFEYPCRYSISGKCAVDEADPSMNWSKPIKYWYLPAALFWRLQSRRFWESRPPNGRDGFHFPRILHTEIAMDLYSRRFMFNAIEFDNEACEKHQLQGFEQRWNERRSLWLSRRPWIDQAIQEWHGTPWGYIEQRKSVERFIVAYRQRNEAECIVAAQNLIGALPPIKCANVDREPVSRILPKRNESQPPQWIFHCLGLLMLASLPLRHSEPPRVDNSRSVLYKPSSAAEQSGYVPFARPDVSRVTPKIPRRDVFFDRLGDYGWSRFMSRRGLMSQVYRIIAHVMVSTRASAPYPLFAAVERLLVILRMAMLKPDFNELAWLAYFPFEFPKYDPNSMYNWDPNIGYCKMDRYPPNWIPGLPMTEDMEMDIS